MRQQRLIFTVGTSTSIPLSSRGTLLIQTPLIPMVADRIIRIYNASANMSCPLAVDNRFIVADSMDLFINFWASDKLTLLAQIAIAPTSGWTAAPVSSNEGISLGVSGDPLIELYGNMILAGNNLPPFPVPTFWNAQSGSDVRNTDAGGAHSVVQQLALLYAEETE